MNALRTHVESTGSTPTSGQTGYSKDVQGLTSIIAGKHYHDDIDAFATHLNTLKPDERKSKVLG